MDTYWRIPTMTIFSTSQTFPSHLKFSFLIQTFFFPPPSQISGTQDELWKSQQDEVYVIKESKNFSEKGYYHISFPFYFKISAVNGVTLFFSISSSCKNKYFFEKNISSFIFTMFLLVCFLFYFGGGGEGSGEGNLSASLVIIKNWSSGTIFRPHHNAPSSV